MTTITLTGHGPHVLPTCVQGEGFRTIGRDTLVLRFRTTTPFQLVEIPIAASALESLKEAVHHAVDVLGMGKTTQ